MNKRCIASWGLSLSLALFATGCGGGKPAQRAPIPGLEPQAQPADSHLQAAPPTPHVDQMDASADTVDALARKAEQYTKEVSPLVEARSGQGAAPPAPSRVEWLDPSEFSLGAVRPTSADPAPARPATVQPAIDRRTPGAEVEPGPQAPGEDAIASAAPINRVTHALAPLTSDALAQKLAQRVKDYPRDPSAHLEHQLLQFLLDEQTPQLSVLSSLTSEDRELITVVLDGLTNLRNALRADSNMLLSQKIKPILDSAERLRAQAELTIPTIALCTNVNGYGSYDPIEPARFPAGQENRAIVYCEVANFTSMLNEKRLWETRLTWEMTLYTEQGMSVWDDKTASLPDMSRVRRHDFFVRKLITLPPTLTIGRYLLKVTIIDTQSNRVAEATTPLVIEAR